MKKKLALALLMSIIVILSSCSVDGSATSRDATLAEDYIDSNIEFTGQEEYTKANASRSVYGISTEQQKNDVLNYLNRWKNEYFKVRRPPNSGSKGYILMQGEGNAGPMVSTSEALGYGMRLLNYKYKLDNLGGEYINNHKYLKWTVAAFDFNKTRNGLTYSSANWYVPADWDSDTVYNDREAGPATDGDMDIAYGLILGSQASYEIAETKTGRAKGFYIGEGNSSRNYALEFIRGIAINYYGTARVDGKDRHYLQIAPSDWTAAKVLTRPSDWMPHHLRTFIDYYNDFGPSTDKSFYINRLQDLLDGTLAMIFDKKWGGAVPDFIIFENGSYRPFTATGDDAALFRELGENIAPNHLSWNACRAPWRFSEYYQLTGRSDGASNYYGMRNAITPFRVEMLENGYAENVGCEYDLNFNKLDGSFAPAFAAPAAVTLASMYVPSYGAHLYKSSRTKANYNLLINKFKGHNDDKNKDGYYDDSINAFCLLLMTDLMKKAY